MRRGLFVLGAVFCAGVVAAACSSSPGSHTTTGTTAHNKRSSTTTSTTSVPPTTASTTTSTTGIVPCAQVSATPGQAQGAAGTIVGTITLTPVGSGTCTIDGYPTLAGFSASGAAVPVTVVNGITVNLSGPPTEPPSLVTLASGQQAEFTFQYSDVPTGSETSCASSTTLAVTTPGASSASTPVPLTMAPCNNATVDVSPVYAAGAS